MIDTLPTTLPRLDAGTSQRVFRALLDALAHPGRVVHLRHAPAGPPALLPLRALADVDVTVAVLESDTHYGPELVTATDATLSAPADAHLVAALRPLTAADVAQLRRGTAPAPEDGAKLAATVAALAAGPVRRRLSGPGVDGAAELVVDGLDPAALDALAAANRGFPAGIDTWLLAPNGSGVDVVGLPRSTRIEEA